MNNTDRQNLPTILELIDTLSPQFVSEMQFFEQVPPQLATIFGYTPEGKYTIAPRDGFQTLIPSGFRSAFYRGQNRFYHCCKPSLHRIQNSEKRIIESVKRNEFIELVLTHPVIDCLVKEGIIIDKMALAQHYGFATNLIDISCDLWCSAFFATTQYNAANDSYSPVDADFGDGIGVLYISKRVDDNPRITELGFNFFPRPYRQMGATYSMEPDEDFNDVDLFEKHFFRHDKRASQWVFEMSYRQMKYFPKDVLAEKAASIKEAKMLSTKAINSYVNASEGAESFDDIKRLCEENHYQIKDELVVSFDKAYKDAAMKQWNEEIKQKVYCAYLPLLGKIE